MLVMTLLYILWIFHSITGSFNFVFFFFQAEDGIRDLVRSRGLGDVYKRQGQDYPARRQRRGGETSGDEMGISPESGHSRCPDAVSYTHLTLPTSDLV